VGSGSNILAVTAGLAGLGDPHSVGDIPSG